MGSLRVMLIRAVASRGQRWPLLLAGLALVIVQLATISHLIGHSASGENAGCVICLRAGGSVGAAPPASLGGPVFQSITSHVLEPVATLVATRAIAIYRARAPPVSA